MRKSYLVHNNKIIKIGSPRSLMSYKHSRASVPKFCFDTLYRCYANANCYVKKFQQLYQLCERNWHMLLSRRANVKISKLNLLLSFNQLTHCTEPEVSDTTP